MSIEIISENDKVEFLSNVPRIAIHLVRDAIEDIADQIESQARLEAPQGDTGALKAHPVDRTDVTIGEVETRAPLFGGGFAIRGPTGFIRGVGTPDGKLIARSTVSVAEEPSHAIWVHNGTGIYGRTGFPIRPRTAKFLVFDAYGKHFVRRTVRGQTANPFLERAYVIINKDYIPLRIERLRLEIRTLT